MWDERRGWSGLPLLLQRRWWGFFSQLQVLQAFLLASSGFPFLQRPGQLAPACRGRARASGETVPGEREHRSVALTGSWMAQSGNLGRDSGPCSTAKHAGRHAYMYIALHHFTLASTSMAPMLPPAPRRRGAPRHIQWIHPSPHQGIHGSMGRSIEWRVGRWLAIAHHTLPSPPPPRLHSCALWPFPPCEEGEGSTRFARAKELSASS